MPQEYVSSAMALRKVRQGNRKVPKLGPIAKDFYNRGVNASARGRGVVQTSKPMSDTHYWNASLRQAYGKPKDMQLSGWLDDAIGNYLPGLAVQLNPQKLITAAQGLLSPSTAQKYATTLNKFGVSATYQGMEVTPNRFATAWKYAGLAGVIAEVPVWAWVLGAGGVGLVGYWMMKK